jgi:hypothetical protein
MARMVALVAQRGGDLDTALEQVRGRQPVAGTAASSSCSAWNALLLRAL